MTHAQSSSATPSIELPGPIALGHAATRGGATGDLAWETAAAPGERQVTAVRRRRVERASGRASLLLADIHSAQRRAPAITVDLAVLVLLAWAVRPGSMTLAAVFAPTFAVAAYLTQAYDDRDPVRTRGVLWFPARVIAPSAVAALVVLVTGAATESLAELLWPAAVLALTGVRCLTWPALVIVRRRGLALRRTLVIGQPDTAAIVWRRLVEFPEAGLVPVQLLSYDAVRNSVSLDTELDVHRVEHVILVSPGPEETMLTAALPRHRHRAPHFSVVPAVVELFLDPRSVTEVGGIPLIPLGRVTRSRHTFPGKRVVDVVLSALLLTLAAPLLAACALAIWLDDGSPVIFRQTRVGQSCRPFSMLKFRTMVRDADRMLDELRDGNETDGLLFKMRDDPRITRVGRLLRRTSLDELPQLWNVLRGDMSLVGPRPLPVHPDDFAGLERERHSVLPGITGYWQLSGGPELTYAEMVRLDLAYIRNWSLWLDLKLLLRTVPALLHRHGAG